MKRTIIGAQGEITMFAVDQLPEGKLKDVTTEVVLPFKESKGFVISHSESGNHHMLLERAAAGDPAIKVFEATENVPEGMKILYAILENPSALIQDADEPHGSYDLEPGVYEFRIAREFDVSSQIARTVFD